MEDTVDTLRADAIALNNRYDGRPPKPEEVPGILIRLMSLLIAARSKK